MRQIMGDEPFDMAACLEQVRQRDEGAARELVQQLYPLVIKIVRSHRPRRMAEEDLAQDVFLKMFANLEQYAGQVPFPHWVSRIAVTTCIDKLRYHQRRPELRWADLNENEAAALDAVISKDEVVDPDLSTDARMVVDKLLDSLNPDDRLVIQLLDLEQKTVAEIETITGWKTSAIKVRAHRARKKMKKFLEQLEQSSHISS